MSCNQYAHIAKGVLILRYAVDTYRLTPGSEAVLDIPEAVYYTALGWRLGRYSKQLRGISGTAEGNHGINLFVA